jgi:thiamine biosynthesis lipoprotein
MGTTYNVKIVVADQQFVDREKVRMDIESELLSINNSMSTYVGDSELSRFNRTSPGTTFSVSARLCHVLATANTLSEHSNGSFDVTVGPLVNLWGFGPESVADVPSEKQVLAAKARVGYQALELNCESGRISKSKPLYVDLSAIAKGYATSELGRLLADQGFTNYMVEIGGELSVSGLNLSGIPWRIAVEKPIQGRNMQQVLSLSNVSVATSGNYRNFIEVEGKKLSHTIDPNTGHPVYDSLASVSVIAESGELADGWATALNVMGYEKGFALADSLGLAAYFISHSDDGFEIKYTNQFEPYMVTE